MAPPHPSFPFRWVLPSIQIVVCLALLWPVRSYLLFAIIESIHSYSSPTVKIRAASDSKALNVIVPPITPEEQRRNDVVARLWETRKMVPLALDFPVLVAQLPYILLNPAKREWVPRGMFPDIWRALSWPFAGIFFWWLVGRGVEALAAARRSVAIPQIRWVETGFALILFGFGLVALIGILTSTPDDRRDIQFVALITGGLLWGVLATATIAARFLQWRSAKRSAAA